MRAHPKIAEVMQRVVLDEEISRKQVAERKAERRRKKIERAAWRKTDAGRIAWNKQQKEWQRRNKGITPREHRCKRCDKFFTPTHLKRTVFCSDKCRKRQSKSDLGTTYRKKARIIGVPQESVNKGRVFHRDKWRCQHCKKATPRWLRGTNHPDSPELDHILPMNRTWMGAHTYINTQCLCRACNGIKNGVVSGDLQDLWQAEPRLRGYSQNELQPFRVKTEGREKTVEKPAPTEAPTYVISSTPRYDPTSVMEAHSEPLCPSTPPDTSLLATLRDHQPAVVTT